MNQPLDDELFDELTEPEGPASRQAFDEADGLEDLGEPLGADPFDSFDPADLGDAVEFDAGDVMDELEDAAADALDAADSDEFFGKLFSGLKNVVKKVAPIVSQVAPLLPIPGAGLIGKAADIVSQVAADEADEFDAFDAMLDVADEADSFDAAAPVVAALALRKAVPAAARLPHAQRKQLVKATSVATRHIAQRHGPAAVAAVPAIIKHARRIAVRQGVPARQLPHLIRRTAAKVAQSPQLVRRFARASSAMRSAAGAPAGYGAGHRMRHLHHRHGWQPGGWQAGGGPEAWGYQHGGTPARWHGAGHPGRHAYGARHGGGGWSDRRITLQGPVRITVETI